MKLRNPGESQYKRPLNSFIEGQDSVKTRAMLCSGKLGRKKLLAVAWWDRWLFSFVYKESPFETQAASEKSR